MTTRRLVATPHVYPDARPRAGAAVTVELVDLSTGLPVEAWVTDSGVRVTGVIETRAAADGGWSVYLHPNDQLATVDARATAWQIRVQGYRPIRVQVPTAASDASLYALMRAAATLAAVPVPTYDDSGSGGVPTLSWIGDRIAFGGIATGPHLTGQTGADGSPGTPGAPGHSPVLTWTGDQIAIDGVVTGPHLTGQTGADGSPGTPGTPGHSPVLTWVGDQIAIDGVVAGPHLTGQSGSGGTSAGEMFRALGTAVQTIQPGVVTKITAMATPTVNEVGTVSSGTVTITVPGVYLITVTVAVAGAAAPIIAFVGVNGAPNGQDVWARGTGVDEAGCVRIVRLAAGDTVAPYGYVGMTAMSTNSNRPLLQMVRVGT